MPKPQEQIAETQDDLDTSAAIAEISADLFGQGGDSSDAGSDQPEAGVEKVPATVPAVEASPSQQPGEETPAAEATSAAVQEIGAPKTWSKEALQDWASIPARAQQEIQKREEDALRGITMYKQRAEIGDRYEQAVEPFRPILQAENIDPVQMFQSFAANHYILSRGTEAQKLELAANMIAGYQIDFEKLINYLGSHIVEPVDPRVAALEQEVRELRQGFTSRQQQEQAQTQQQIEQEIEAFAADPANVHFPELVDDISKLFETGQATTLKEAYEKAVYLNPTTRQKEIERLTAAKTSSLDAVQQARQDKIARSTAADLSLDPKSRNGTVALGSIDDTLAETMARIAGRG